MPTPIIRKLISPRTSRISGGRGFPIFWDSPGVFLARMIVTKPKMARAMAAKPGKSSPSGLKKGAVILP
jgi:hypothetical protein